MGNSLKTILKLDDALASIERVSFSGLHNDIIKALLKDIDESAMPIVDKVTSKATLFKKALA